VCLADASTGEMKLAECGWEEAGSVLSRTRVAEWLVPSPVETSVAPRLDAALAGLGGARSAVPVARYLDATRPPARWSTVVADAHADLPLALAASAAALDYLDRTQGGLAAQMTRVERWNEESLLRYDAATARHLELFAPQPGGEAAHTLWYHLNLAATAPGSRRLRSWLERPLASLAAIRTRRTPSPPGSSRRRRAARSARRCAGCRIWNASRRASPAARPRRAIWGTARRPAPHPGPRDGPRQLGPPVVRGRLPPARRAARAGRALERALVAEPPVVARDGDIVKPGFDELRDSLHALARSGKQWIAELEASERERTGIPSLRIGYNKVFGYYIEITNSHRDKAPSDYERRQTLTNAERYVTPALKAREAEVLGPRGS